MQYLSQITRPLIHSAKIIATETIAKGASTGCIQVLATVVWYVLNRVMVLAEDTASFSVLFSIVYPR